MRRFLHRFTVLLINNYFPTAQLGFPGKMNPLCSVWFQGTPALAFLVYLIVMECVTVAVFPELSVMVNVTV